MKRRNDLYTTWSESDLVLAADKALYAAKAAGRACARMRDISDVDAPLAAPKAAVHGG